jgi:hypothetical protein
MHVLPAGFHRIRYYGLLAGGKRAENIARAPRTARVANNIAPQQKKRGGLAECPVFYLPLGICV